MPADDDVRRRIVLAAGTLTLKGGKGEAQPLGKPASALKGADWH